MRIRASTGGTLSKSSASRRLGYSRVRKRGGGSMKKKEHRKREKVSVVTSTSDEERETLS